jgi:LPS sulfotransferase NodH
MNTSLEHWERADIRRRWEPYELAECEFDALNTPCSTRVILFTQPRTASFSICRYFYAAGWGVPLEYFNPRLLAVLPQRFMHQVLGKAATVQEISRYRAAVEANRSRNSIFTTKVMWSQYSRLKAAFKLNPEQLDAAAHLYLYRSDFAAQVVSFWMQQRTGVYSFSTVDSDPVTHVFSENESVEGQLARVAESLIASEVRWLREFRAKNWSPLVIRTETFLASPSTMMMRIAKKLDLMFDINAVQQYENFERCGRYENQHLMKNAVMQQHKNLLDDLSRRRGNQLLNAGFHADYCHL